MSNANRVRLPMKHESINNKIIRCRWRPTGRSSGIQVARIADRSESVEGIDINRFDCSGGATLSLSQTDGHILSVLSGAAILKSDQLAQSLTIYAGVHLYIPPAYAAKLHFSEDSTCISASAGESSARGEQLLLHDEYFLRAARFILTPQYLSRRAFLHRDKTLVSKSGDPVAWFHTTMFDTRGLPENQDGQPVFKMSYNHQCEINVIYDVSESAKVRFAHHPYGSAAKQLWSEWAVLDGQTTYHLNESANGGDVETSINPASGKASSFRNKHEIYIAPQGHVSLICMFDPGPTGVEAHLPGEYTAYAATQDVVNAPAYQSFLDEVQPLDEMIQGLSLIRATDPDYPLHELDHWGVFQSALANANFREQTMIENEATGREPIIAPWRKIDD